jgi:GNAT superfamily N-acetyltransferase
MTNISIRPLSADDLAAYRALRLDALKSSPGSFSASLEQEEAMPDAEMMTRVVPAAPGLSLGAYREGRLGGMAAYVPAVSAKMRHKAYMVAVYVDAPMRGTGTGRRLVEAIVGHARTQKVILQCTVAAHNTVARSLYHRVGFVPYGLERHSLLVDGLFVDEELLALDLRDEEISA